MTKTEKRDWDYDSMTKDISDLVLVAIAEELEVDETRAGVYECHDAIVDFRAMSPDGSAFIDGVRVIEIKGNYGGETRRFRLVLEEVQR